MNVLLYGCVCMYVCMYVCMCVRVRARVRVCACAYACACVCVCVCVCVNMGRPVCVRTLWRAANVNFNIKHISRNNLVPKLSRGEKIQVQIRYNVENR